MDTGVSVSTGQHSSEPNAQPISQESSSVETSLAVATIPAANTKPYIQCPTDLSFGESRDVAVYLRGAKVMPERPSTPPDSIKQERLLGYIENHVFFEKVGRLIPEGAIRDMEIYASTLLNDYPPETYTLLLMGAQNVILSGILHNKVPDDIRETYLIDLTVKGLSSFYVDCQQDDTIRLFNELAFPSKEQMGDKLLVIVRVLQGGYTVESIITRLNRLFSDRGMKVQYDFFYAPDRKPGVIGLLDSLNVTYKLRHAEAGSKTSEHSMLFQAVQHCSRYEVFLAGESGYPASYDQVKRWGGKSKPNPCFDHLRDYLRRGASIPCPTPSTSDT